LLAIISTRVCDAAFLAFLSLFTLAAASTSQLVPVYGKDDCFVASLLSFPRRSRARAFSFFFASSCVRRVEKKNENSYMQLSIERRQRQQQQQLLDAGRNRRINKSKSCLSVHVFSVGSAALQDE